MSFDDAFDVTDVVRSGIANWFEATPDDDVVVVVAVAVAGATTKTGSLKLNRLLELSPLTDTDGSDASVTFSTTETGFENLNVGVFDSDDANDDDDEDTLFGFAGESKTVSAVLVEMLEAAPTLELLPKLDAFVRSPVAGAGEAAFEGAVARAVAACVAAGFCRNPKLGSCFISRPVVIGFERWAGSGLGRCSALPRSTALSPSFARTLPPDLPKSEPKIVGLNDSSDDDVGAFRSLPKPPERAGTEKGI